MIAWLRRAWRALDARTKAPVKEPPWGPQPHEVVTNEHLYDVVSAHRAQDVRMHKATRAFFVMVGAAGWGEYITELFTSRRTGYLLTAALAAAAAVIYAYYRD